MTTHHHATRLDRAPDCDVLIVGAGPVGQITALLLAQHGLQVIVLERWEQPYPLPRAVALAHDNVRVLHTLGLGAKFTDLLEPWGQDGQECLLEDSDGHKLIETHFALHSPSGHPQMSAFSQPDLELVLENRVHTTATIDQRRGVTVHTVIAGQDRASVVAVDRDGTELTVSARYIVGCDGANSVVREQIGAPITDMEFDQNWLVVDVVPHASLPNSMRHIGQRLGPGRPTTFVPAGPRRRRFEFMIMPGEDPLDLDTTPRTWELLAPWGFHPANSELTRHARYTFRARWATRWRAGRILLAGDAAHQMPPFLGQGLNSGIRDAANLAWRLPLIINGTAPDTLLDEYAVERTDQVATIIGETVGMGGLICTTDPQEAALRDEMLKNATTQLDISTTWPLRTGTLRDDPGAGTLGLQARVGIGGRVGLLDELFSSAGKFMLIATDNDPTEHLDPALTEQWRTLSPITAHFGPGGWTDTDGDYARWFDTLNARVVLMRPDFHVFGSSPGDTASTNNLIADLLHHTTQPAHHSHSNTTTPHPTKVSTTTK